MIQIGEFIPSNGLQYRDDPFSMKRIGVMASPQRRGRYRSYSPEDIGRLTFIRRARELGFTLDEVRALLGLASGGPSVVCGSSQPWRVRISKMSGPAYPT